MSKSFLAKDSVTAEADWFDAGTIIGEYTSGFYSGTPDELPSGTVNQTLRYNSSNALEATDYFLIKSGCNLTPQPLIFNTDITHTQHQNAFLDIDNSSFNYGVRIGDSHGSSAVNVSQTGGGKGIDVYSDGNSAVAISQNSFSAGLNLIYKYAGAIINSAGSVNSTYPLMIWDGATEQIVVDANGRFTGYMNYKKAATGSQLYQYNNIVVDEEGNYEKQLKNISIKQSPTTISLTTPATIPEMTVYPMRSNFYHLDFRIILEKQAGGESADVMYDNGMQFIFSNSTANDVVFFNGLTWRAEHYYNATLGAQAHYHKHANFNGNQTTDALINSVNTNVQRVVLHGEGVFVQDSGADLLNLKLAYVQSGAYTYSVAAGSYMKIELKNEGA